jgi:predicted ribosome quality control (RQC) complex YloA/Tae2 family protein
MNNNLQRLFTEGNEYANNIDHAITFWLNESATLKNEIQQKKISKEQVTSENLDLVSRIETSKQFIACKEEETEKMKKEHKEEAEKKKQKIQKLHTDLKELEKKSDEFNTAIFESMQLLKQKLEKTQNKLAE